jgi:hypothetical protein
LVWSANSEGGTPTNYDVYFSEDSDPAFLIMFLPQPAIPLNNIVKHTIGK